MQNFAEGFYKVHKISCVDWKLMSNRLLVRVGKRMSTSEFLAVTGFIQMVTAEDWIISQGDPKNIRIGEGMWYD